tara:strand:+ start:594 stop:1031 length:438 start_codon:yes stop_codon:yes gene_type:complete
MIYLWLNIGVLPFWLLLIFFPQTKICQIFTTSIFPLFIFSLVYGYLIFEIYKSGYNFLDNFNLYLGFDELINLFSEKNFLILFWIHFLSINLFCGSWIVKDSQKIGISKFLTFFPLILTYFIGPIGLMIYWMIRIFFAKKISLYD